MEPSRVELLSVIVPVFNSAATLEALHARLSDTLPRLATSWEIILVNDGSRDGSWEAIQELARRDSRIRGIDLSRNSGQHAALLCGVRRAAGNLVVTLDDDLQHPPEEIAKLLAGLSGDVDLVYGRAHREEHDLWRTVGSRVIRWALGFTAGAAIGREASAFRLFRTELRNGFKDFVGPHVSLDVLLSWSARASAVVPVEHRRREAGTSTYTLRKLLRLAMDIITGYSVAPLQFASILGLAFTGFGLGVLVYVVGRYFIEGGSVPGFPFLAATIAIFSGVQLLTLGIFGQYLGRIHQRSLDRPAYVVREESSTPRSSGSPPGTESGAGTRGAPEPG
ncbi:MAG: glycosyltransferase family 2 protein [Longimicrobiales bacterium]|nr:glycosyltransferase family 2 protein [Longimicrobiales bacterium]